MFRRMVKLWRELRQMIETARILGLW